MASFSTSSVPKIKSFEYDVFLSFRGEDTRRNFVDHLYHALVQQNIETYKDDENMVKGERISDELIKAIEDSRFYVIVFSKTYASSSWCLDELVKIMEECQKTAGHTAYPVFYDVEPTEVRNQIRAVGKAFAKNKKKKDAGKWRKALKEAADLAGFPLKTTANGHEAQFIQEIVKVISQKLDSINFIVDDKLVGMERRIKDVVSSLEIGSNDVLMIGIKGMGGGGKTTLARAIFNQISPQFEGKSFVENVRVVSQSSLSGLKSLQEQILSNVLGQTITVNDVDDGKKMMKKKMRHRKVLVVLDDVDYTDQLAALEQLAALAEHNWFGTGSRIIITTRDEHVLAAHRVNLIHDVNLLSDEEAICLFSRHAFEREIPNPGYEELSGQVLHYAAGLPLTVKVLGSFLCDKDELEWKDTLERLETIPLKETLKILELSYNGLEDDYKEMFLNVACIMKGWRKDKAIRALESCGFYVRNGLKVLEQKSLITVSKDYYDDELLGMHDHIEEMGRNIVRRLHPDEPSKHSRLWIDEEIEDILAKDLGTEATRYIKPFTWKLDPKLVMQGLGNMRKLTFLAVSFTSNHNCSGSDWKFDEVSPYLPNALTYLDLNDYPFRYLPKTFEANNLVRLQMMDGSSVQLWEGGERKVLKKLRFLELILIKWKTIDLGLTPNLETLKLQGCDHMMELQMNGECLKLKSLAISGSKLSCLDLRHTPNLETLLLLGCDDLEELHLPVGCPRLKSIDINFLKLSSLDLRHTMNLERLIIYNCKDLVELHVPVKCLKPISLDLNLKSELSTLDFRPFLNLETLHFTGCDEVEELHMPVRFLNLKSCHIEGSKLRTLIELERAPNLEKLILVESVAPIELHMCDSSNVQLWEGGERKVLDKLKFLELKYLKLKTVDLGLTPNLETLSLQGCDDLEQLHVPIGCLKLESLNINGSELKSLDLGRTPNLKTLLLERCFDLAELHMPIGCLKLESLNINGSKLKSLDLGRTPNLKTLLLERCDLAELHMPIGCLKLKFLNIKGSKLRTLDLVGTRNLENLYLRGCYDLERLHMPVGCAKLKHLDIIASKLTTLDLRLTPNLEVLHLEGCDDLVELQMPIECLKLLSLKLNPSKLTTLDLRLTPNLELLHLEGCDDLVELQMPIECLKLQSLELTHSKLRTFDFGLTPDIVRLSLKECNNLVELHAPVGCLKQLGHLNLSGCLRIISFLIRKMFDSLEDGLLAKADRLIAESVDICSLHSESNFPEFRFECFDRKDLLSLIRNFEELISEGPCACINLSTKFHSAHVSFEKLEDQEAITTQGFASFSTLLHQRIMLSSHAVTNSMFNLQPQWFGFGSIVFAHLGSLSSNVGCIIMFLHFRLQSQLHCYCQALMYVVSSYFANTMCTSI